jgi:hypothetical protein
MQAFLREFEVISVGDDTAAGTDDTIESASVDMATKQAQSCCFMVKFGAITASAVTDIRIQQSSDDGSSDSFADIVGSKVSVAATDDDKIAMVEIVRPTERYVRCQITRATANAVIDSITAVIGNLRVSAANDDATVAAYEIHKDLAEGTA